MAVPAGINGIQTAIANNRAVAILVNAPSGMDSWYNKAQTDVFTGTGLSGDGHWMMVVGYDDTIAWTNPKTNVSGSGAFLIQNSWGTSYGYQGRWWVSYPAFLNMLWEAYAAYPATAPSTITSSGGAMTASGGATPPAARVVSAVQHLDTSHGDTRVNLVLHIQVDGALRVRGVKIMAPGGQSASQALRTTLRHGYLHFSRRDGRSFPPGDYEVLIQGVDARRPDAGVVTYTTTCRVRALSSPAAGADLGTEIHGPTGGMADPSANPYWVVIGLR